MLDPYSSSDLTKPKKVRMAKELDHRQHVVSYIDMLTYQWVYEETTSSSNHW